MVVLHTIGSHRLYDLRYPNEFKVFNPTCINNELYYSTNECLDAEKLGNSYDNTIVYTDYFLSELICVQPWSKSLRWLRWNCVFGEWLFIVGMNAIACWVNDGCGHEYEQLFVISFWLFQLLLAIDVSMLLQSTKNNRLVIP